MCPVCLHGAGQLMVAAHPKVGKPGLHATKIYRCKGAEVQRGRGALVQRIFEKNRNISLWERKLNQTCQVRKERLKKKSWTPSNTFDTYVHSGPESSLHYQNSIEYWVWYRTVCRHTLFVVTRKFCWCENWMRRIRTIEHHVVAAWARISKYVFSLILGF